MTDNANASQCSKKVSRRGSWHVGRCTRRAVRDGFCKVHHPESVKARQDAALDRYKKESEERYRRWAKTLGAPTKDQEIAAMTEIAALTAEVTALNSQVALLRSAIDEVVVELEGRVDGAPDAKGPDAGGRLLKILTDALAAVKS